MVSFDKVLSFIHLFIYSFVRLFIALKYIRSKFKWIYVVDVSMDKTKMD